MSYQKARKIVQKELPSYSINTERKWQYQNKYNYNRHPKIPYSPNIVYKNKGWVSWAHWLGTNNIRGQLKKYIVNEQFLTSGQEIWLMF